MNKEELLKEIIELPKIETNNHISAMNGINVSDLMSAVDRLNKIPDYNDLLKENKELEKQLETINEQANYLRKSVERKEERIIDLQYTNEYVDKLLNQQKEFILYLENEIKRINPENLYISELNLRLDDIKFTQYLTYKEILQKYKSIIGVLDEKSNNISS